MKDDDIVKIESMIDDPEAEAAENEAINAKIPKKKKSFAKGAGTAVKNAGTRAVAGGLAVAQTASVTSIAAVIGIIFGITGLGEDFDTTYRDDVIPDNPYECIDEYSDAYRGIFGTINESPLAPQNATIVQRLKEINEWSKTYVGQSVPDRLVCTNADCPYYGHEGCTDPNHGVEQVSNGTYTYYDSGAQIDLANVRRIHDFFSEYGLTDVQIAAICGVMTMETRIDFTSLEGYNIQGDRYNLDPSAVVTGKDGKTYGFKPWAEGLHTPTCLHEVAAHQSEYTGEDQPIDYADYSSEYGSIYKLGIGIVGFTDGPGFYNNTFLRNYADKINDRVTLIQKIVEGSRGWRENLRMRAADLYHYAYGAEGEDKRGTANHYVEKVEQETLLILPEQEQSTGWRWKKAYEEYVAAEKALEKAVNDYNDVADQYSAVADELRNTAWKYHEIVETPVAGEGDGEDGSNTVYHIDFEKHSIEDMDKKTTDINAGDRYLDISNAEELKAIHPEEPTDDIYIEYPDNPSGPKNHTDVYFPEANPIYQENPTGALVTFSMICHCPPPPRKPTLNLPDPPDPPDGNASIQDAMQYMIDLKNWENACEAARNAYASAMANYNRQKAAAEEARAEHARIQALINKANGLVSAIQDAYKEVQEKKEEYFKKLAEFNEAAFEHAKSVVNFYNALQDYYTAVQFDMESKIRDAAFISTTIFDDTPFYSEAAYEYVFHLSINNEQLKFYDVFKGISSDQTTTLDDDKPSVREMKLYYELWQNYAKYATNLPQNGKYINWWTPEVQLLFLVGGSYDAEKGEGIKVKDEFREPCEAGMCGSDVPERDTVGQYYYDWMSSWKGENYTARDLTTATRNFFYDMISGGFDDGTLTKRTEYAYAYYYMFQYDSPYQQAINYAAAGGEASKIMDEMIAEGRWQTNTSNTLSDTAMPHNDKWKQYQTNEIVRQWEIDTSTSMSKSMLATFSDKQNHSRVNLLTDIWNGCRYINVIDNSTIANSAMYLVDNPLIYGSKDDEFYIMKYGANPDPAPEPVSSLTHVVYDTINARLAQNGKSAMSGEVTNGFNFVKTSILWSGMDTEFENITSVDDLKEYLKEATSSIWQDPPEEEYQNDLDPQKSIGRGNSKIWEQRKLGPYYDESGSVYYRYKWELVPRVLDDAESVDTDLKWYDDMRNDPDAERGFGDVDEDLDKWDKHKVDEHDTNNAPSKAKGEDVDGYKRKLNENQRNADWVRVDWECWDKECEECGGTGGHGDYNLLVPGDVIIHDNDVFLWLGENTVQNMFPLEKTSSAGLCMAGGSNATKLKSITDSGFEWSKPCEDYINHETPCPTHVDLESLPTTPEKHDDESCIPYNPDGKWTVYRLITPNYTDAYRSAGVIYNPNDDVDWETWYKYKYKGMAPNADTKQYLEEVRKKIGQQVDTNYPRDYR